MAGKSFVRGERFTLADILFFAFLDFAARAGHPFDPGLSSITPWYERMKARPSAKA